MTFPSSGKFFPHLVYDRADGRVFAWGGPGKVVIVFDTREGFVDYALGRTSLYDHTIYSTKDWLNSAAMTQRPYREVHDAFVELAESWVHPDDVEADDVETPGEWFNNARTLVDRISDRWKLPRNDAIRVWHHTRRTGHSSQAQLAMDDDTWRDLVADAILQLDLADNIGTRDKVDQPSAAETIRRDRADWDARVSERLADQPVSKPVRKPTPIPEM